MRSKPLIYPMIPIAAGLITATLDMTFQQIIAIVIFTGIIGGTLLFWRFRIAFALIGISLLMATGVIDIPTFITFASLDVILFLLCMMTVIGFLEERKFFEVVVDRTLRLGGDSATKLIIIIMFMSALSAALVDEVTSILFMMASVITISARLQVPLFPLMLITVFATNIGSSATVVGNPIGVLIALNSGYGFLDFLRWATPPAIMATLVTFVVCRMYYRDFFKELDTKLKSAKLVTIQVTGNQNAVSNFKLDRTALLLFVGVIGGLVLHTPIEELLGLKKNTMLIGVALIGAGAALLLERDKARELLEKRVDWWTLTFFLLFFASVGTLKYTGVTSAIADALMDFFSLPSLVWIPGFYMLVGLMSAFMDNVLAVAFWIPVVQELLHLNMTHAWILWWLMLFAGTYMGNLTMIGSTANIVAIGMVERQRLGHVTFLQWLKPGLAGSFPPSLVAIVWLLFQ
ncbi:MAG: SLC13 family permease [Aigarchaeota archaeon]|nr:SLC13 family permease [Aigarchaeota archaeon]MDW8092983.1 SLC13 family permease [Nitrososphaerota archaeon]